MPSIVHQEKRGGRVHIQSQLSSHVTHESKPSFQIKQFGSLPNCSPSFSFHGFLSLCKWILFDPSQANFQVTFNIPEVSKYEMLRDIPSRVPRISLRDDLWPGDGKKQQQQEGATNDQVVLRGVQLPKKRGKCQPRNHLPGLRRGVALNLH